MGFLISGSWSHKQCPVCVQFNWVCLKLNEISVGYNSPCSMCCVNYVFISVSLWRAINCQKNPGLFGDIYGIILHNKFIGWSPVPVLKVLFGGSKRWPAEFLYSLFGVFIRNAFIYFRMFALHWIFILSPFNSRCLFSIVSLYAVSPPQIMYLFPHLSLPIKSILFASPRDNHIFPPSYFCYD